MIRWNLIVVEYNVKILFDVPYWFLLLVLLVTVIPFISLVN